MIAWKIFELGEEYGHTVPKTLFHGKARPCMVAPDGTVHWKRSRVLQVGIWHSAEIKTVTDGSRREYYTSGFHCYPDLEAVAAWFKTAKTENRVVVAVQINSDARDKPGAVRRTLLADRMKISSVAWDSRMQAEELLARSR